ncbi:hypothetical protein GCM10023092_17370 [Rurimicrobium arvi]|uniref:DUF3575 domain-containing protein n=1 Tax=Rurimicrobium arvi TaxID=2049916 RepID=A0ABP8MRD4_9BACT
MCRDLPVTVERFYKRHTVGLTLGYRSDASRPDNPNHMVGYFAGSTPGFTTPRFKAVTLGINTKYYLSKRQDLYLDAQFFYRYWWHNTRFYEEVNYSGSSAPRPEYNTSARNHVLGTKLLFGVTSASKGKRRIGTITNLFVGLGFRVKWINEDGATRMADYYNNRYSSYTPYSDHHYDLLPSIHLGVSFGMLVRKAERADAAE